MNKLMLSLLAITFYAQAGKLERDYMKEQVKPAIDKAKEAYKSACGCTVDFKYDEKTKLSVEKLSPLKFIPENFGENAAEQCKDEVRKKLACGIKTINIEFGSAVEIKVSGSTAKFVTADGGIPTLDMLLEQLDK